MKSEGKTQRCFTSNASPTGTHALLILSENRIYREGLRDALAEYAEFDPVLAVASRTEAWQWLGENAIQMVLIDAHCNDLHGLLSMCASSPCSPKIMVLGIAEEKDTVIGLASEGIHGYLDKEASLSDLLSAIQHTCRDELACSPAIAGSLLQQVSRLSARQANGSRSHILTNREQQLAQLIAEGFSNKEISAELGISVATVKSHVHHILEKLGIHRRTKVRDAMRGLAATGDRDSLRW